MRDLPSRAVLVSTVAPFDTNFAPIKSTKAEDISEEKRERTSREEEGENEETDEGLSWARAFLMD